jgi:hypothetical protein
MGAMNLSGPQVCPQSPAIPFHKHLPLLEGRFGSSPLPSRAPSYSEQNSRSMGLQAQIVCVWNDYGCIGPFRYPGMPTAPSHSIPRTFAPAGGSIWVFTAKEPRSLLFRAEQSFLGPANSKLYANGMTMGAVYISCLPGCSEHQAIPFHKHLCLLQGQLGSSALCRYALSYWERASRLVGLQSAICTRMEWLRVQ